MIKTICIAVLFFLVGFTACAPMKKECQHNVSDVYHQGVVDGIGMAIDIYVNRMDKAEAIERNWHPEKYP